jgi:protein-S-isoprenylcysteine O-methyltransferase Ste14
MRSSPAGAGPLGRALAWAGGAAFVASLLFCAWSYASRFGDAQAASALPAAAALVVDLALFGTFALHHSVFARSSIKAALTRHVPAPLERSLYVWTSSLLLAVTCAAWQQIPGTVWDLPQPWRAAGYLVQAIGLWLTVRAASVIDPWDLAGIRQATGTERPPQFRVIGPYHRVRHPIYLGWILLVFGTPHMTATRLAFAGISTAYLIAAIPYEERSLVAAFGEEYRRYQRQVRWRLVPYIF